MLQWLRDLICPPPVPPITEKDKRGILEDIKFSLQHLMKVASQADQPTRAILQAQIFILIGKVDYLLGNP